MRFFLILKIFQKKLHFDIDNKENFDFLYSVLNSNFIKEIDFVNERDFERAKLYKNLQLENLTSKF